MSFVFFVIGISDIFNAGSWLTTDGMFLWALFSIADALWMSFVFGGKK